MEQRILTKLTLVFSSSVFCIRYASFHLPQQVQSDGNASFQNSRIL
jgi:hypothetical protein